MLNKDTSLSCLSKLFLNVKSMKSVATTLDPGRDEEWELFSEN